MHGIIYDVPIGTHGNYESSFDSSHFFN